MSGSHYGSTTYDECALQCVQDNLDQGKRKSPRFINPHRLFHGVWTPQWLEERTEVSEKAKKLYAYLAYFAGCKGYAWPTFNTLADRLHVSRRHMIRLVKELSAHGLILSPTSTTRERAVVQTTTASSGIRWMQTNEDAGIS